MRAPVGPLFFVWALALAGCDSCSKSDTPQAAGDDAGAADAAPDGPPGILNSTPVPTAVVEALVNPGKLPAYSGPTGSVEGTVTIVGDPSPATPQDFSRCPAAEKIYGTSFRTGEPATPGGPRPLADAVVVVTGYSGFYIPEKQEAKEIKIQGCGYDKRTLAITFGQRIEIKNETKDFWTPTLEPGANLVMMMAPPNNVDPVKIYPKKPGHWLLTDHDRKYVVVDVYAFLHPLHATTSLDGHYRIDGLPVGKVMVNTTHPRLSAEASTELDVKEGVVQRVDLKLEYHAADGGTKDYDAGITYPQLR